MRMRFLAILIFALNTAHSAEPLQCRVGPVVQKLGGTEWRVYSCDDGHSLVFITMSGNPAMPFVFIVQRDAETAKISGEGNGSKEHSAAAFEELKSKTAAQFNDLVQATKDVSELERTTASGRKLPFDGLD